MKNVKVTVTYHVPTVRDNIIRYCGIVVYYSLLLTVTATGPEQYGQFPNRISNDLPLMHPKKHINQELKMACIKHDLAHDSHIDRSCISCQQANQSHLSMF